MRPARMLLGVALVLSLAWPARGGVVPVPASVLTEGAEVRCKPGTSDAVYVTQKLPRGTVVEVVEKLADGWLKIDPPRGSFSWINTRVLRFADGVPGVWIVAASEAPVPVFIGSPFKPGKPDVIGTSLTRGAQVIAIGAPHAAEDGSWLPILPPAGEFRYVRETDVSGPTPGATTAAQAAKPGGGGTAELPPVNDAAPKAPRPQPSEDVRVPGPATAVDPLLPQAEQLERAGDRAGAAGLYEQLGNKYAASNHEAAVQYYNHAAWLRSGTPPAAATPVSQPEALYRQAQQYEQSGNRAEAAQIYTRLGDLYKDKDYSLSLQYYNRAAWLRQSQPAAPRVSPTPPATGAAASTTTAAAAPTPTAAGPSRAVSAQMVGPGVLKRSGYPIDGRPTYVLESPTAQVIAYLTPQAGVDLEHYVGQNVEAIGQLVPRTDLRDKYLTVARVRSLTPTP